MQKNAGKRCHRSPHRLPAGAGSGKAVDRQGLLGALTGGLSATAGGIAAALCFGFLAALLFKGKPQK